MAITFTKQINLDKKSIIKALQTAAYEKAVEEKENVGSFDAFCLRTKDSVHFLAGDNETEVALSSVAIMLPNKED